jgi:hypothetical protein
LAITSGGLLERLSASALVVTTQNTAATSIDSHPRQTDSHVPDDRDRGVKQ